MDNEREFKNWFMLQSKLDRVYPEELAYKAWQAAISHSKERIAELEKEAEKLKQEAVTILDRLMGVREGYSSGATNRFVECVVSCAMLNIALANKNANDDLRHLKVKG